MTPQEQELINGLFDRLSQLELHSGSVDTAGTDAVWNSRHRRRLGHSRQLRRRL